MMRTFNHILRLMNVVLCMAVAVIYQSQGHPGVALVWAVSALLWTATFVMGLRSDR